MDPEGRIRTSISVVDSDALCQLSYPGVVPEVYLRLGAASKMAKEDSSRLSGHTTPGCTSVAEDTLNPQSARRANHRRQAGVPPGRRWRQRAISG